MNPVQKAVELLDTQAALARACGQPPQAVTRWLREGRVPAKYAPIIEAATDGQVTRHDLRPDIFGEAPDPAGDAAEPQQQVA